MNKLIKSKSFILLIICIAVLALTFTLDMCGRNIAGFAEWYSGSVYPVWVNVTGFISGIFPFALGEILIILLIAASLSGIVFLAVKLIRGNKKRLIILRNAGLAVLCLIAFIYLIYTLNCGINYNRTTFSAVSGLETEKYSVDELKALSEYLLVNANAAADEIQKAGGFDTADTEKLETECVTALTALGSEYSALAGFYPQPKALIISEIMSHLRLVGIYNPFTIEANYNKNAPKFSMPFTVCHELSHLKGFMQEDEANYIAYLACRKSDNIYLKYSGYVQALNYTLVKLYDAVGKDEYFRFFDRIHPLIQQELRDNNKYWEQYQTKIAEVSSAVNDTYLKVQGVQDGEKSYGRFVDLMISDCKLSAEKGEK